MKTTVLTFSLFLFFQLSSAQIVTKDSVAFNNDFTEATLFLEFTQSLSQDTIHASGLPFSFAIMAPYDSISIASVSFNDDFTEYEIKFNTKPDVYYSLLSYDIQISNPKAYFNFDVHFFSGDTSIVDLKPIHVSNEQLVILKTYSLTNKLSFGDIYYKPVMSILALNSKQMDDIQNKYKDLDVFDLTDSLFRRAIYSFDSFHFEKQNEWDVSFYRINHQLFSSITESVLLLPIVYGRNDQNIDKLSIPIMDYNYFVTSDKTEYYFLKNDGIYVDEEKNIFSDLNLTFYDWDDSYCEMGILSKLDINDNRIKNDNSFFLQVAYPNPFNPTTSIQFSVATTSEVQFTVFDILGREVKQLFQPKMVYASGNHSLSLDFSGLPSGVYLVEAIGTEISSGIVTRQSVKVSLVK